MNQIKRACELEIGITSPDLIEIVPLNDECHDDVGNIIETLQKEG
ncbi:hypothetical protein MBCUT_04580 [Methanobrevibacter cuticularis]|uniref:Uncharacterized protein n=1 Tax=Methanobrevibacter cuticularis TaxID=47311 RepID=A0A166CUG1_9EURY|nr:hypothetical protein [Methanobrevibacter cuticularis]KZX16907.1 hypothetical protein MBCUT_04580 [Methanobrevibacter cuticularis]